MPSAAGICMPRVRLLSVIQYSTLIPMINSMQYQGATLANTAHRPRPPVSIPVHDINAGGALMQRVHRSEESRREATVLGTARRNPFRGYRTPWQSPTSDTLRSPSPTQPAVAAASPGGCLLLCVLTTLGRIPSASCAPGPEPVVVVAARAPR